MRFKCDYCGVDSETRPSHFARKKRHFCSAKCYSNFRKELLPKEEQHAYRGGGLPEVEKKRRAKARSDTNHAIRDGKLTKESCGICGREDSQAHHRDYDKPLEVEWLCVKCHWDEHKIIYENPELMSG